MNKFPYLVQLNAHKYIHHLYDGSQWWRHVKVNINKMKTAVHVNWNMKKKNQTDVTYYSVCFFFVGRWSMGIFQIIKSKNVQGRSLIKIKSSSTIWFICTWYLNYVHLLNDDAFNCLMGTYRYIVHQVKDVGSSLGLVKRKTIILVLVASPQNTQH